MELEPLQEPSDGGTPYKTIFHWRPPKGYFGLRMLIAVTVAIVLHGLVFYVFRVQEPQTARETPKAFHVSLLNSSSALESGVYRQVVDTYAGIEDTLLVPSPLEMPVPPLAYEPTFANAELVPRAFSEIHRPQVPPSLTSQAAQFPPLPARPAYAAAQTETLKLVLPESFDKRGWLRPPVFDLGEAPSAEAPVDGRIDWYVGVGASGELEFVFPMRGAETGRLSRLTLQLRQARFQPRPGSPPLSDTASLQWGIVSLHW